MCEDGEFLVHANILKKIDKLFKNVDNVYKMICHLHNLSYNEIHIEHIVFTLAAVYLPIVVKLSPESVHPGDHGVHDCTPIITICLPIVVNCLQDVHILVSMVTAMIAKVKTVAYNHVRHGCQFVIIHTYRICIPSECNISFATRDLSSGDIVNDHLAYTCRNVLIENCESFKYLRSNDVNA